jgi:catechol 2,3-dioxygenase
MVGAIDKIKRRISNPSVRPEREMTTKTEAQETTAQPSSYGIAPSGYRLPANTRLGRVRLQIANLDRSLAWYEKVLGLRMLHRGPHTATLGAQGDDRVIVELNELAGATPVPRRGRLGLYHFAILLPNRSALGRFLAHLAAIGAHAGMSDHLVSEAIYLTDPDGLGIEVYADRPRSGWQVNDRQLAMATAPLDVDDLLAAGRGEDWSGMPADTVIGHVHLYVSDIDQAADFYHDGLGFDKVVWSYPGALFLSAGGYHHHLGTNTWAANAPRSAPGDARLIDWEIVVPTASDVSAASESLAKRGFEVDHLIGASEARDPWGTSLRLRSEETAG